MVQPSESISQETSELSDNQAKEISGDTSPDKPVESNIEESQGSSDSLSIESAAQPSEPPPSYVKLAMRNMVKKGSKSLFHFALTTTGLIALFVGLAYLTR